MQRRSPHVFALVAAALLLGTGCGGSGTAGETGEAGTGAVEFEAKGADNSIQRSGEEAAASERTEAAAALHGYLDARAAAEWARACSYLSSAVVVQFGELLSGGAEGKAPPSCAKLLAEFSADVPPASLRSAAVADVGAMRVDGDSAFLLFHGAHGIDYFMPMAREGDRWKVAAIAPSALS